MAKHISKDFIDDLISKTDIVSFINTKVPLKRKSGDNHVACCPFHEEKTPSFSVNASKQFYHCFGCKASGDVLRFIMDFDHLTFIEAVETLSSYNGVEIIYDSQDIEYNTEEKSQIETGLACLQEAMQFFSASLMQDAGLAARSYLRDRGVKASSLKHFNLGYAANNNALYNHLIAKYDKQILLSVGLIAEKEDRCYDWFRDRLIFPILNVKSQVIGFGARALKDVQPKYLNSAESLWFNKRKELYHLNEALHSKRPYILITEGYMDVLKLQQYGFDNAVAALGTAFTEEHLQLLNKRRKALYFCFDGDQAGYKAAEKTLKIIFENYDKNLQVQFIFLPENEDPDSLLENQGIDVFNQLLNDSLSPSLFLYRILDIKNAANWSAEHRAQISRDSAEWLNLIPDGTYKEILHRDLQKLIHTNVSIESNQAIYQRKQRTETVSQPAKLEWRLIAMLLENPQWAIEIPHEAVPALKHKFSRFYKIYYLMLCGIHIEDLLNDLVRESLISEVEKVKPNFQLLRLDQLKKEFFDTITLHSTNYIKHCERLEKLKTTHK